MRCPKCGTEDHLVYDTRDNPDNDKILELKRICNKCGQRFFAVEEIKYLLPPKRHYKSN